MIKRLSHVSFFVLDQASAVDFYINKLGFEMKTNLPVEGKGAWITVSPKGQDLEITLIPTNKPLMFNPDTAEKLADLIRSGTFGYGIFECADIFATCEELKAKGVEFIREPNPDEERPEAMFRDNSGNFFALCPAKRF